MTSDSTNGATFHQNIARSLAARTTNGLDFRYSADCRGDDEVRQALLSCQSYTTADYIPLGDEANVTIK